MPAKHRGSNVTIGVPPAVGEFSSQAASYNALMRLASISFPAHAARKKREADAIANSIPSHQQHLFWQAVAAAVKPPQTTRRRA